MRTMNRNIVLVLTGILVIYFLLLDTLAKPLFESQASEMYGAEIRVSSLQVSPFVGRITLHDLRVADRSNAMRNLAEADRAFIDINMLRLAQDVIDVEQLDVEGLLVFAPRDTEAQILRPLVSDDSGIAQMGLPDFSVPDVDELIDSQRDKLDADINALKTGMEQGEAEWREKIASLPTAEDIENYRKRIRSIKRSGGLSGALSSLGEAQQVQKEIQADLRRIETMSKEFRGDITEMREELARAARLPQIHTRELISSIGLDSDQLAQIGNQILRGELSGILQQVLAPVAYSNEGSINPETTMPIMIKKATVSGPLLPSGAGLSARGELTDFAWPLVNAEQPAKLVLNGETLDGGTLALMASVDHRDTPNNSVEVDIQRLPLRNMPLAGSEGMTITLDQSLANLTGRLDIQGDKLVGVLDETFSATVFDIDLSEDADQGTRLIAEVLESSNDFMMSMNIGGTVFEPEVSFSANLDQLIASTLETAISDQVQKLTNDLQNQISDQIGPQITSAREQFDSLAALEQDLQKNLSQLSRLK